MGVRSILLSAHSWPHSHVYYPMCSHFFYTQRCERLLANAGRGVKNNADAALFSVMAPEATCLSGLLCAASPSFITGHDGLYHLTLGQETFTSPSPSLLTYLSACFSVHQPISHVTFLSTCRISLTKAWCCRTKLKTSLSPPQLNQLNSFFDPHSRTGHVHPQLVRYRCFINALHVLIRFTRYPS